TGNTMGVFYTESPASRLLCQKSRADTFDLLVLNTSIIRPASNRYINTYLARLHGAPYEPPHPVLRDVLAETFGVMVYQEDVVNVCVALAGMDVAEADGVRKALTKKRPMKELRAYEAQFREGAAGAVRGGARPRDHRAGARRPLPFLRRPALPHRAGAGGPAGVGAGGDVRHDRGRDDASPADVAGGRRRAARRARPGGAGVGSHLARGAAAACRVRRRPAASGRVRGAGLPRFVPPDGAVRRHPAGCAAGAGAGAAPARGKSRRLRRDADDGQAGPYDPRRADGVRHLRRRGGADRDGALPRGLPPRGAAAVRPRSVPAAGEGRGVVRSGHLDRHGAGAPGPLRQAARPAVAGDIVTRSAEAQRRRGEVFRRLHAGKPILVLPNVWDVASARIVEQAGFPAIATSSAGVA